MDTPYRAFSHTTKQYYFSQHFLNDSAVDEIRIGLYYDDGSCDFEFRIRWYDLSGSISPRIEIFHDAWEAFGEFEDLFEELRFEERHGTVTPEQVIKILRACDFVDKTKYVDPTKQTIYSDSDLMDAITAFVNEPVSVINDDQDYWVRAAANKAFAMGADYTDHNVKILQQALKERL